MPCVSPLTSVALAVSSVQRQRSPTPLQSWGLLRVLLGATLWRHAKRERCSPAPEPATGSRNQRCEDVRERPSGECAPLLGVSASPGHRGCAGRQQNHCDGLQLTGLCVEQPPGTAEETHSPSTPSGLPLSPRPGLQGHHPQGRHCWISLMLCAKKQVNLVDWRPGQCVGLSLAR